MTIFKRAKPTAVHLHVDQVHEDEGDNIDENNAVHCAKDIAERPKVSLKPEALALDRSEVASKPHKPDAAGLDHKKVDQGCWEAANKGSDTIPWVYDSLFSGIILARHQDLKG